VVIEELDTTKGNGTGCPGIFFDIVKEQEILAEFFFGDPVRRFVVMLRQFSDRSDIGLLGRFGQAS
jgi:hypothetical protein